MRWTERLLVKSLVYKMISVFINSLYVSNDISFFLKQPVHLKWYQFFRETACTTQMISFIFFWNSLYISMILYFFSLKQPIGLKWYQFFFKQPVHLKWYHFFSLKQFLRLKWYSFFFLEHPICLKWYQFLKQYIYIYIYIYGWWKRFTPTISQQSVYNVFSAAF